MNANIFFPLLFLILYLVFKIYENINKKTSAIPMNNKNYRQSNSTITDKQKTYNTYNSKPSNIILSKIIENDNALNSIVDNFEARKQAKAQELEKSLGKALPNDVIWGVLQDIYLESFMKNPKVLLNCIYQQGLLVQKEKRYKQAIAHYGSGLYYLMNFYKADFHPVSHIIDFVSTETELIEMAQQKFINKIQLCVKYANLEVDEIKTLINKFIRPLPSLEFEDFFESIKSHLFKKESPYADGSVGDLQNKPLEQWAWADDNVVKGLTFHATLQLRTPLAILKHHNEIFQDRNMPPPPQYAKEGWEGIWLPLLRTFREIGIDVDDPEEGGCASDIGSLDANQAKDYYEFLLKFHTISEDNNLNVEEKINQLKNLYHSNQHYNNYLDSSSFESYFKLLISDIFPSNVAKSLNEAGFRSLKDLKGANLDYLGTLKGIGKATLEKLKPYVSAI